MSNLALKRWRLWKALDGKCYYCGMMMWLPNIPFSVRMEHTYNPKHKPSDRMATIEHLIPKAKKKKNQQHVLTCACLKCNSHRGAYNSNAFKYIRKMKNWEGVWKKYRYLVERHPEFAAASFPVKILALLAKVYYDQRRLKPQPHSWVRYDIDLFNLPEVFI